MYAGHESEAAAPCEWISWYRKLDASHHKDIRYGFTTGQDQFIVPNLDGDRGGWSFVHGHLLNPGNGLPLQRQLNGSGKI